MTAETIRDHQETVIYHYCDANALLSILTNQKLWYTHAAYLNDTMEIRKGVEFCEELLSSRLKAVASDPVISSAKAYLANAEKWQYYVCCFSKGRDKLSQWRAYANDGDGFAVGFKTHYLSKSNDGPFECRLDSVSYEESPLEDGFNSIVSDLQSQLAALPNDTEKDAMNWCRSNAAERIGGWCIDQSAFHKDAGFSEEEELRSARMYRLEDTELEQVLIADNKPGDIVRIFQNLQQEFIERRLIRSGRFGLTPYIEVPFQPEAISEVICGPRTANELTESSLEILKKKLGLTFSVSRSTATYR
ncbi:DUF2971 domain-containing protein [Planctomycetes bacterium K23_9]|uniref:DUF2971 domain-containing protein n=1 Tax=Stieleria marina TaxID=1930275 RepID=A0A517NUG8_9BACT|nr:hypothetical protein K239x_27570 [Planctomycetes bacterium K23_9]